jgi:chromosome segregation ATPase
MARLGVTYKDIARVADQLTKDGLHPTIGAIRQVLGTGSSTTIANHLRQWRAEQDGQDILFNKEQLPQELITCLKNLWLKVLEQADQHMDSIQKNANDAVAELQRELDKYRGNNQRWQQLFNQWLKEKEALTREKDLLEQKIEMLQNELQTLRSQGQNKTKLRDVAALYDENPFPV